VLICNLTQGTDKILTNSHPTFWVFPLITTYSKGQSRSGESQNSLGIKVERMVLRLEGYKTIPLFLEMKTNRAI